MDRIKALADQLDMRAIEEMCIQEAKQGITHNSFFKTHFTAEKSIVDPKCRLRFEITITSQIISRYKEKQQPINVVAFNSGGLTQMRIIANTLRQHPQAKINLALIDPKYSLYALTKYALGLLPTIDLAQGFTLPTILHDKKSTMDEYISQVETYLTKDMVAELDKNKFEKNARLEWVSNQLQHQELVSWIRHTFPEATFNLQVFGHVMDYINHIEYLPSEYPDLIEGSDFMDEMSLLNNSSLDYCVLLAYSLIKTDGKCFNLALNKDENVYIKSSSLKQHTTLQQAQFLSIIAAGCSQRFSKNTHSSEESSTSKDDFIKLLSEIVDIQTIYL